MCVIWTNHFNWKSKPKSQTKKKIIYMKRKKTDGKKYFTQKMKKKTTKKCVQVLVPTAHSNSLCMCCWLPLLLNIFSRKCEWKWREANRKEEKKTENLLFKFTLSIYRNLRKKISQNLNECIYYTCHRVHLRHRRHRCQRAAFIDLHVILYIYWHWCIQSYYTTVNCEHHSNTSKWSSNLLFVFHFLLSLSFPLWIFMFF